MEIEIVAEGLQFPEGPVAMPDGSVILVEIKRQTLTRVSPGGGKQIIASLPGGPNGAALGPDGRGLWETWSAEASKNDAAYTAEKWDSFSSVRSVTVGTLFWLARQNGWRAERVERVRTSRARIPDGQDADDQRAPPEPAQEARQPAERFVALLDERFFAFPRILTTGLIGQRCPRFD